MVPPRPISSPDDATAARGADLEGDPLARAVSSPDDAMAAALALARLAAAHGDVPVGAIVVGEDGSLLGVGKNERELTGDPTAHAEVLALRAAARAKGHWRLEGATLYVSLEPCAMCAGALVSARLARLVFGARDPKAGAVRSLYAIADDRRLNHRLVVEEGLFAEESARLLRAFFARLRAEGQK